VQHGLYFREKFHADKAFAPKWCTFRAGRLNLRFESLIPCHAPSGFATQLAAFVLFRFFDAVKPGPVAWADRLFKGFGWRGGWGILWDDLVAAFCTLLVIALWRIW
jgi:hypothetical protein